MAMTADGLAKLIEERAELGQISAKKVAYFDTDVHPDGNGSMAERMESEMGDVLAAIEFVTMKLGLSTECIQSRRRRKLNLFMRWDAEE